LNAKHVVAADTEQILEACAEDFRRFAGKTFLLTGGAGFLGYTIVNTVLRWNERCSGSRKIRLTILDNFIRGTPPWVRQLQGNGHLSFFRHDVTIPLPETLGPFQYIIHAASIASPVFYRQRPIETMDANVQGLRILLDYARNMMDTDRPLEGFLFFSSSEIYGDPSPSNIPTPETYHGNVSCTGPRACYDESKRYGETLCVNFARHFGVPVKIARPFNNYGPGLSLSDGRVIPDFARNILDRRDIVMFSDGSPTRTFCYSADAVTGYFLILGRGNPGEAYNIGAESPEISMADLAGRMMQEAGNLFGYQGASWCAG